MSLRLPLVALLAAAVVALFAVACGGSDDDALPGIRERPFVDDPSPISVATPAAFPVNVIRSDGKPISVPAPAQRIVSLSPGATETLFALGAGASVVAVDSASDEPAASLGDIPRINAASPDAAAIAALTPDLVIVGDDVNGIVAALDDAGLTVLYIDTDDDVRTVEDVYGQIALLGRLTAADARALELTTSLNARVKAVQEKLEGLSAARGPRVYYELDTSLRSVSAATLAGDVFRIIKGRLIAEDAPDRFPVLTDDEIIAFNPEIILLGNDPGDANVDAVRARPGWGTLNAVVNGRIYAIDDVLINRPGPRIVDGIEFLARQFYPETFGE